MSPSELLEQPLERSSRLAKRYALVGLVLGAGAPAGFALARRLVRRVRRVDRLAYGYMGVATPMVFGLFGLVLGRDEDRRRDADRRLELVREEFAAIVAHDLRNPLQAILLRLQLLQRGTTGDEVTVRRDELGRLERSALRLSEMVDDLLDACHLEAARLRLTLEPVSLAEAIPTLVDSLRPKLLGQEVAVELERPLPLVDADPARLAQIVTNLLDNAAKYGASSRPIVVRARPSMGGVALSVEDQGAGIEPELMAKLFDRFFQARRSRERKTGLGLGLYLTKGLVEAHGGRIEVRSRPGRGTTFTVHLPASTTLPS